MKFIIKENKFDFLSNYLESKVNDLKIEGLCYVKISKMATKEEIALVVDMYLDADWVDQLYNEGRPLRIHKDFVEYQIRNHLRPYGNFRYVFYEYETKCNSN
jgi:hypothetical protein